jgi:hypothetical protein
VSDGLKFEIDFPKITVDEGFAEKIGLVELMGQEAQTTRTRILANVNSGKDAEGSALRPYSPAYAKQKSEKGVGGFGPTGSTTPNLLVSGELHRAMQAKVPKSLTDTADIFFEGSHKGGFSNAGLASSLQRRGFTGWFQFGSADLARIFRSFSNRIYQNVSKIVVVDDDR